MFAPYLVVELCIIMLSDELPIYREILDVHHYVLYATSVCARNLGDANWLIDQVAVGVQEVIAGRYIIRMSVYGAPSTPSPEGAGVGHKMASVTK